jgi:dTDP-4-dehydrorhamnose 3,5-epimerase
MEQVKVQSSRLEGVKIITPPTNFEDFRGEYVEIYNEELYHKAGINTHFMQDDISMSSRHVLRGIHGDQKTTKLISCLFGKFYLVVINNIPGHPQYSQWESFTLSDKNRLQVFVPQGFGNGHLVLSETAIFHYKQTTYYDRSSQFTLLWNDPDLKIWWPIKNPIISQRDEGIL